MKRNLGWQEVFNESPTVFTANSIYNKPDGISLEAANKVLVTFAFTRHPFERLVSAYFEMQKLYLKEHCNYPKGMPDEPIKFAKFVINVTLEDLKTEDYMSRYTRANACYFLNPLHFIPQSATCPYCQLKFDFVGKLENMKSDTAFLAQHLGIQVEISLHVSQYIIICIVRLPTNNITCVHF